MLLNDDFNDSCLRCTRLLTLPKAVVQAVHAADSVKSRYILVGIIWYFFLDRVSNWKPGESFLVSESLTINKVSM